MPVACSVFGHRPRFRADGETLRWECGRGCGELGEKRYETAADASRYARAFDPEDRDKLGVRAPVSLFLMRLVRRRSS